MALPRKPRQSPCTTRYSDRREFVLFESSKALPPTSLSPPYDGPIPNIATDALQTRVKQSKSDADTLAAAAGVHLRSFVVFFMYYSSLCTLLYLFSLRSIFCRFNVPLSQQQQQQHEIMPPTRVSFHFSLPNRSSRFLSLSLYIYIYDTIYI